MINPDYFVAAANAGTALTVKGRSGPSIRIVDDEPAWRSLPAACADGAPTTRVIATRWHSLDQDTREVRAETPADRHLVAIVLRNEDVRFSLGGRIVHDGLAIAGMLQVTEPGVSASCVFRGPYNVIHLHVPNRLIAECSGEMGGAETGNLRADARLTQDPVAERLARALLAGEEAGQPYGQLYADCISTAIVARLLGSSKRTISGARPKVAELARWRLRRVTEYVEANLGEPTSLADLATAAGLTRMHFAAQFRAATGHPPHEYLLRRRIERAQEMLIEGATPLVEIALSVGFQTQSHFTSVFKRFVGRPPRAWREALVGERACRADCSFSRQQVHVPERAAA
jgi:AraC family transcriptional regulator